jgi:phosphate acetyltransferase
MPWKHENPLEVLHKVRETKKEIREMAGKLTFDSIRCGDVLPEVTQHISQEDIWHYAAASLDMNPVHCAPEWCKTAQVFGIPETVQHGAQTQSLLCKVITNWCYASGAMLKRLESKFIKPVPVNSTCTYGGVVTELHPVGKGRAFVTVELWAKDQGGDQIAVATAQVVIPQ